MRKEPIRRLLKSTFFTLFPILYLACASIHVKDSYFYDFYEKARLLMTEEEDETYRHLPDAAAKELFIEEFWKIRDPDPATEENEFRDEFRERIEFANENFSILGGAANPETSRGWNTDRGRIYLVLGPPDWMHTVWREKEPEAVIPRDVSGNPQVPKEWISEEHWHFQDHHLTLVFLMERRHWVLASAPPDLLEVLEDSKLELISPEYKSEAGFGFQFRLRYEDRCVCIDVPVQRIHYAEKDDKLRAQFDVTVLILKDGEQVQTLQESKEFLLSEEELLERGHLEIRLPYVPPGPGEYLLQVKVEDVLDPTPKSYQKSLTIKGFWLAR